MKINNILAVIIISCFISVNASAEPGEWRKEIGRLNENVTRLFILPEEESRLFIGTENTIYILDLAGKRLAPSLIAGGTKLNVYAFEFIPGSPGEVLAATDKGVFSSRDKGRTWRKQSFGMDSQSQQCFSLLYDQKSRQLYAGTAKGLYIRKPGSSDLERDTGIAPDTPVYNILQDHDFFYAVTAREVVRFGRSAPGYDETVYKLSDNEEVGDNSFVNKPGIKELIASPDGTTLFMALPASGLLRSIDHGGQWQEVPLGGISVKSINNIAFCPGVRETEPSAFPGAEALCLATKQGAYVFQNKNWVRFDQRIAAQEIMTLTVSPRGVIYAATDTGIYSTAGIPSLKEPESVYNNYSGEEPTIQEVHQMVIDYADVSPDKIKDWKGQARMKAFFPSLSVGLDRVGTNLFHWNTAVNPDELQKGRDYLSWDISLSWDFSDFIWSSDQTSIDSRAKLMVELREDLLSQVTRIYFERRRIQMEILGENPGPMEVAASCERQLRVAELTAIIDAMTGGRFSRKIGGYAR